MLYKTLGLTLSRMRGREKLVERPRHHAGNHCRKQCVDHGVLHLVQAPNCLLGAQVEDPVGPDGSRGAVVEVKEPDGAVNKGEAHGKQRVHRADGEAVKRKLHRLGGGLGDLPRKVRDDQCCQDNCQDVALAAPGPL